MCTLFVNSAKLLNLSDIAERNPPKMKNLAFFFDYALASPFFFFIFVLIFKFTPNIPIKDMANRKLLKKTINGICSDIFAECVAASLYSGKPHSDNVDSLLESIIKTRNDFVSRISHPEPGMKPKVYYDHLAKDFAEHISEYVDYIVNLSA